MYVTPAKSVQFKGYTRFLSCNSEGKGRRLSDCPFGTASFGDTRGLTALVKKFSYPAAGVEETVGKLHDNITNRVYVAEPNEVVTDMIKLQHDYIVYDYEPEYPDIRENFYEENINKKGFESIKSYLKRLEAAEIKKASDSEIVMGTLQTLRRKLVVADECSKIYDEGGALREQKADYERKIQARRDRIAEIEEALPKYKRILERHRTTIKNYKDLLAKKETALCMLGNKKASFSTKGKTVEEMEDLNKRIECAEQKIKELKNNIEKLIKRIDYLEDFINKAPQRICSYGEEIIEFTAKVAEISRAAEPYIRRLCEVYTQNGIKIIKRM